MEKTEAMKLCICRPCPSFKMCSGEKMAFCLLGKSKCIKEMKGCLCGGCPVHKKMHLTNGYYCVKGSEKELTR